MSDAELSELDRAPARAHPDQERQPARRRDPRGAVPGAGADRRRPPAHGRGAVPRPRLHRGARPRRRHRRRPAAASLAPRRRARGAGRLDPRPVRRRSGGRLRLGPRRDRHEGHGGDGGAGHAPPRPRRPRRRPRSGRGPDPRPAPRRHLLLLRGRGGRRLARRRLAGQRASRLAAGRRRAERGRRHRHDLRRRPLLSDPGGGEGLRRLQDPRQGSLGPRLRSRRRTTPRSWPPRS